MFASRNIYNKVRDLGQSTKLEFNRQYQMYDSKQLYPYFEQLLLNMFYELVTSRSSDLLSQFYRVNGLQGTYANLKVNNSTAFTVDEFDALPIVSALAAMFQGDAKKCESVYQVYSKEIFRGKRFADKNEAGAALNEQYKQLDHNLGVFLSHVGSENAAGKEVDANLSGSNSVIARGTQQTPVVPQKEQDAILRIHDTKLTDKLNKFAEERRVNDLVMTEQIQRLQLSLQDELKQIMEIREGIDYNITQEAISQFISLHTLISETLPYHPNDGSQTGYHNLVESCEDFLVNVEQSLVMLGVELINDVGKKFDPERHKTSHGAVRGAMISKVVKIGFTYKNKVLEKAEVELA